MVVPARINDGTHRVDARLKADDGIVFGRSAGSKDCAIYVLDSPGSGWTLTTATSPSRGAGAIAKNELLSAGNLEQGEILRGRTDENQIVVLGVVERKQGAALHSDLAVEESEDAVQFDESASTSPTPV